MIELAVQRRPIAIQIYQEQTVLLGLLLHVYQRAPLLQAPVDGGQVILPQLIRLATAQYQRLQVCGGYGAAAGQAILYIEMGEPLALCQSV